MHQLGPGAQGPLLRVLHPRPGPASEGLGSNVAKKGPPSGPGSRGRAGSPQRPSLSADRGRLCPGKAGLLPHLPETIKGVRSQGSTLSPEPQALPKPTGERRHAFRPQGCRQLKGLLDSDREINK